MINAGKQGVFSWEGRVAEDKGEKNGELKETISLPLGCIPLTKMFNNIESDDENIELEKFINNKLDEISWLTKNNKLNVIGIGGIAKHIGRVAKGDKNYPKESLHDYSMTREEVSKIYKNFLDLFLICHIIKMLNY